MNEKQRIAVLDFGSQYAHLIAKRFRSLGFYSVILSPTAPLEEFRYVSGIVFSGSPASIYANDAVPFNADIFKLHIPILGLCYGHYVVAEYAGGKVEKAKNSGEYGFTKLKIANPSPLFEGLDEEQQVWMSHQDEVVEKPYDYEVIATTEKCRFAALQNLKEKRFSLQFHAEVKDTTNGNVILLNFAKICGMEKNRSGSEMLSEIIENIKVEANGRNVLLFLSGGVDSSVTFALLNRALGEKRVAALYIDSGFMRKGETDSVKSAYESAGFTNFECVDKSALFLNAISGITDPQEKRRIVGETFIRVREEILAQKGLSPSSWLLAQGTLYPDIIESGGSRNSKTIKTHHNRVGLVEKLIEQGLVIEPLKDLYKDEVRLLGTELSLPESIVMRHPFPGPGLSVNVLCSPSSSLNPMDTEEWNKASREAANLHFSMFCPSCLKRLKKEVLPVRSVGVQGDYRTYRFPLAISFGADGNGVCRIPSSHEVLAKASVYATNNSTFINRVILELYKKPTCKVFSLRESYCTKERLDMTREVDAIASRSLHESGWYKKIFQHLSICLPYGGKGFCFVLRPLVSEDVMTARWAPLPFDVMEDMRDRIRELDFVDALYFDLTNKPPATFCWE